MKTASRFSKTVAFLALPILILSCAPEVGSERWCERMSDKPKGDWTANEAVDYAKHCVFEGDDEERE